MGSDANVAKGLALGADAYITKPFSNSEVIAKVRELMCR
jgi:DNA-binding response OmpR family regulator